MTNTTTSPIGKRDLQKKQTAQTILGAAKKLFAEQGFDKTTTRAIATKAGVGIGTVFAHYPDKASLLGEALRGEIDSVVEQTRSSLTTHDTLEDKLVFLSEGLLRYYSENHNLSRELIKNATFQGGAETRAYNDQMAGFIELVSDVISSAVAEGVLNKKVRVPAMALNYMAIHFLVVWACLRQDTPSLDELLKQMQIQVASLIAGYRTQAP